MSLKFTGNTKSTLDVVVPVSGAGIVFYYLFREKKTDLKQMAIATAIVLVILYVVTTQITKRLLAVAQKPADLTVTPDSPGTIDNNSSTSGAFDAASYAQRLFTDIEGVNVISFWTGTNRDYQLYDDMVLLSNQNLLLIYNAWQANYYSQHNETLVQAMKGEDYPNFLHGTNDTVQTILNRYASLGAA